MKKVIDFCKEVINGNKLILSLQIVVIGLLLYAGVWCMTKYETWNKIPSHQIEALLSAEGLTSDKSYCNLRIRIGAGGFYVDDDLEKFNTIEIRNDSNYTDSIKPNKLYTGRCGYLYQQPKYKKELDNKSTFYILDFNTHTNIKSHFDDREYIGVCNYNEMTLDYIEQPQLKTDSLGTHTEGSGILAYGRCDGGDTLQFNTNLGNSSPTFSSSWDITQANYDINFKCSNIKCDTISIEFIGATEFSAMYPTPNKTTVNSIEFTDSASVNEILRNGLRFHTQFVQMKELSSRRTFLLSAVFSLLISLVASIVYKFIFYRKQS